MQHHCLSIAIHQLRQAGGSPSIHVTIHVTVHVLHALASWIHGHGRARPETPRNPHKERPREADLEDNYKTYIEFCNQFHLRPRCKHANDT